MAVPGSAEEGGGERGDPDKSVLPRTEVSFGKLRGRVCPGSEVGAESPPQSNWAAGFCVLEIKVTNAARVSTSSLKTGRWQFVQKKIKVQVFPVARKGWGGEWGGGEEKRQQYRPGEAGPPPRVPGASPPPWVWAGVSLRGTPPPPLREEALPSSVHVAGIRLSSCRGRRLCRRQSLLVGAS